MVGLVQAIPINLALRCPDRDRRDKPGDDATGFAPLQKIKLRVRATAAEAHHGVPNLYDTTVRQTCSCRLLVRVWAAPPATAGFANVSCTLPRSTKRYSVRVVQLGPSRPKRSSLFSMPPPTAKPDWPWENDAVPNAVWPILSLTSPKAPPAVA